MLKTLVQLLVAFSSSFALAWGAKGHQIVAYTGGDISSDGQVFWLSNLEPLRQLSTVPDRLWKLGNTKTQEGPNHWFQADSYFNENQYDQIILFPHRYSDAVSKYGENTILKNGTAPWRIRQLYQMALQAFKNGDMKSALEITGAMTHYIGDLAQPLHASENFDGQLTNNKGIHAYFETTIIKDEMAIRAEVKTRALKLLQDPNFKNQFKGSLMDAILNEVERSVSFVNQILKIDKQYGRSGRGEALQLDLAKDRLADGAATLAVILNRLWIDSGLQAVASPVTIQDPEWIKPDFGRLPENFQQPRSSAQQEFLSDEQDCLL